MKKTKKNAISSLLATVTCVWQSAVFAFENWLDDIRHPDGKLFANDAPSSTGRHLDGIISYFANSTQTANTTAPWTNRYQVVIFGNAVGNCYLGQTAGEVPLGVCLDQPDLPGTNGGQPIEVAIPGAYKGTTLVYATGVIAYGTLLKSNGDGTVVAWTSGSTTCLIGVALTASTATGDYIEMAFWPVPGSSQTGIATMTGATF